MSPSLQDLELLLRVAEARSFARAGKSVGLSQPSISKRIASVERELNATLFVRSRTGVRPTLEGEHAIRAARAAVEAWAEASAEIRGVEGIAGHVRVTAPAAFARLQITPRLPKVLEQHPALTFEIVAGDSLLNLAEEGIDLAIRMGPQRDSEAVCSLLAESEIVPVASPDWLGSRKLSEPADLEHCEAIIFTHAPNPEIWTVRSAGESHAIKIRGRLWCNNFDVVREAALVGLGPTLCPLWAIADDLRKNRLVRLLPDWAGEPMPIYAVRPATGRPAPRRVATFIEFLRRDFRERPGW